MSVVKLLLTILISFFLVLSCSETQDAYYKNIDEAIRHGAVEKGWIPDVLPKSSYEIYERHDLDTNTVWLRFKFDKRDINELIAQIKEVSPSEIDTIVFASPNIRWWPRELSKDLRAKGQSGLRLYKFNRVLQYDNNAQKMVPAFFVIDWHSNIVYYWQHSN